MLIFWSLVRNSVVLAVYLLFSVACFFTVHEHYFRDYKNETFNLHPLTQQNKIVNILNHVKNMIQFRNKELQLLNELIKSLFGSTIIHS